jgi:hypothetical protein
MTASRNKNSNNGSNGHTSKAGNQSNGTPPTMSNIGTTAVNVNGGNGKTLYARRSLRVIDPESHVSSVVSQYY